MGRKMLVINVTKITKITLTKDKGETLKGYLPDSLHREGTLENGLVMYLAFLISKRVQEAVRTQTINGVPMKAKYKPLSSSYNKSKPKSTQNKFWKEHNYLIKNLKIWRNRGAIYLGYPYNALHPESGANITDLLKWLETGTVKIAARPLFGPIIKQIIYNPDTVIQGFLQTIKRNNNQLPKELYIGYLS